MSGEIRSVTKDQPCLHCGKPDWCYRLGYLSCCKRNAEPADGWIKTKKSDKDGTPYYALKGEAKPLRPKAKKEFIYCDRNGCPLVRVTRIDDGKGGRKFPQSYYLNGRWVNGLPRPIGLKCPIYRYPEVRAAIAEGKQIFFVEGEGVADKLWEIGIPATTTLGGSGKYRTYGNYEKDLLAAKLVLCPDRDVPGLVHMDAVAKDFPSARWLYAPPSERIWGSPPENGGLDLADWIQDGTTREQILAAIGERRQAKSPEVVINAQVNSGDEYLSTMEQVGKILEIDDGGRQRWELEILAKSRKLSVGSLLSLYQQSQQAKKVFEPKDAHVFLAEGSAEFDWIIGGYITKGTTLMLYAKGGCGKSLLAYDLCKAIATGQPWNGYPTQQGKVLIVQTDEPDIATRERLSTANFASEVAPGQVFVQMDWQFSQLRQLHKWIEQHQPSFIMIDSLTSTNRASEEEENSTNYGNVFYSLRDIANQYGCTIMVLHHENKLGDARGASSLFANVSEVWHLTKPEAKDNLSQLCRILEIEKSRSYCSGKYQIELNTDDNSWQHHGDYGAPETTEMPLSAKLLGYLEQHRGVRFESEELVHEFGGSTKHTIYKALEKHRKKGLIHAEERIREHPSGAKKYRVYFSPQIKGGGVQEEGDQVRSVPETFTSKDSNLISLPDLPTSKKGGQGDQVGRSGQSHTEQGIEHSAIADLPITPDTPPSFSDWEELLNQEEQKNTRSNGNDTNSASD